MRYEKRLALVLVSMAWLVASCASRGPGGGPGGGGASPPIVFMSDFGIVDDAVAQCKGAMLQVYPGARIVDLTHQVTPFSIPEAARFLFNTTLYYPAGTLFVVVVDPGVGSSRKPIVARSRKGHLFVGPDNGIATSFLERDGLEWARAIEDRSWHRNPDVSSTFHGRDIFSSVAAYLAAGRDPAGVGPLMGKLVEYRLPRAEVTANGIQGEAVALDGQYGNVITNVEFGMVEGLGYRFGEAVPISIGKTRVSVTLARWFSEVAEGKPLIYNDSQGRVALAVNLGNFARRYRVTPPMKLWIPKAGAGPGK